MTSDRHVNRNNQRPGTNFRFHEVAILISDEILTRFKLYSYT